MARFSVLTVTHERPERLRGLLRSLASARIPDLERVVLVDDSRKPSPYAAEFPGLPIDHLVLPQRTFISRAKGLGLARVPSEFVYLIDDDNVVEPGSFGGLLGKMEARPRLGALMPSVLYHRRPDLVWVYAAPFSRGRWGFDLVGRNRPRAPALEDRLLPTDALPNAALVRTDAARAVGGFDVSLPVNSSAAFCQALKSAGWEVWADSGTFVRHDVEPPGSPGFWGAHSVDAQRLFFEVHDWFLFQRRLRSGEGLVRPRALLHAAPFLAMQELAFAVRSDVPFVRQSLVLVRGALAGLNAPLQPAVEPRDPAARRSPPSSG